MTSPFKTVIYLLCASLMLALAACAGDLPPAGTAAYQPQTYRLSAGDQLNVTVFGEEALTREYTVSSAGDLSFPLLGDIQAAGKSVTELQDELAAGLAQGYLNDPRVTVEVMDYRPFYILGEVQKAGEYPFRDDLTVMQAVALAGGFTYRADQKRVFIRRAGMAQEQTYEITSDRQFYIAPGDTVRFGERYF